MITNFEPWYIIVNPRAGSGKTIGVWNDAREMLDELGVRYVSVNTECAGDARKLACSASAQGYRKFVAVGGDGTLHEVVEGIVAFSDENGVSTAGFCITCIPIGSGNDWVKTISFTVSLRERIERISRGEVFMQDIVDMHTPEGSHVMLNVGGAGFDSRVCEKVNRLKSNGHRSRFLYVGALLQTLIGLNTINVDIFADGEKVYSGECYSIALGNGRYSGGGMLQTAGARIDDGLVDVMVVPRLTIFQILSEIHRIFDGTVESSRYLKYFRCRSLEIVPVSSDSSCSAEADGELIGKLPLKVEVRKEQIGYLK